MTIQSHEITTVRKVVVFFDICSSTTILEDLIATESQKAWRDLLISLKFFLNKRAEEYPLEVHKFVGDGWIILFDQGDTTGLMLLEFCRLLAEKYRKEFTSRIRPRLQSKDYSTGITFGVDRGSLVKIWMNGQPEYIGRALNVAARLQNSIKQKDETPAGKLLISGAAFVDLGLSRLKKFRATKVTRILKNVSFGPSYQAHKIVVSEPVLLAAAPSKRK